MSSNRVFYASQAVGFKADGVEGKIPTGAEIHGAQSLGITTNFNLEQVFELGQIEIYENIENIPDIEVTIEKVLDDTPLIYHIASSGSSSSNLAARTSKKSTMHALIYPDSYDSCSGDASIVVIASGLYISSLNYTFPVDGNCTESVSFVGNDKRWETTTTNEGFVYSFDNTDTPGADGVQRRENVIMGEAANCSIFPTEIPGISASGTNKLNAGGTAFEAHIQTVTVSTDLGREALYELGRRGEYYRYASFPVEVTTTIELTATDDGDAINADSEAENLTDQKIRIVTSDDTQLYMGEKNKLASVEYGGGDTGGGNATVSLTYTGYNTLTITNPSRDPDAHAHVDR